MQLTKEQILKLQNLSAIKLSGEEEEVFFDKLGSVIDFLSKLKEIDVDNVQLDVVAADQNLLQPIVGVSEFTDTEALLANVEHEKINNSVVVKSVFG